MPNLIHTGSANFHLTPADREFHYQPLLTQKLEQPPAAYDQHWLNEIMLWKVNRYPLASPELFRAISDFPKDGEVLDGAEKARASALLEQLLQVHGVNIPVASTLLRFLNPGVYQIIDQRVYRMIYAGKTLYNNDNKTAKKRSQTIEKYFTYLTDLRSVCAAHDIPFELSDRILYMADKRLNKGSKLAY